jgi:hypothetical protein
MDGKTRLFFVVDSKEDNEEIFDTYEDACDLYNKIKYSNHPRMYIAKVKNAFREKKPSGWNYDDLSDTFEIVQFL